MNNFEKSCALIGCYEHLEAAINEIAGVDSEDENLANILSQLKGAIGSVNVYIKELNK